MPAAERILAVLRAEPGITRFLIAERLGMSVRGVKSRTGIAVGVLELKRSTVSVTQGIRVYHNQKKDQSSHSRSASLTARRPAVPSLA